MIYIVFREDLDLLCSSDKLDDEGVTVRYCSRLEQNGAMRQYVATDAHLTAEDCQDIKVHANFFLILRTDEQFEQWLNEFNPNYKPNPSFRFAVPVEDITAEIAPMPAKFLLDCFNESDPTLFAIFQKLVELSTQNIAVQFWYNQFIHASRDDIYTPQGWAIAITNLANTANLADDERRYISSILPKYGLSNLF